jgi:uncharacterized protein (TIGR00369 family)
MSLLDYLRAGAAGRYWDHLGIEQLEAEDGRGVCRVALRDHHLNYNDVAHGGVISGLIDSAAGLAARSLRTAEEISDRPHATSDLHVQYLSAARGVVTATGTVVKAGRTALFAHVDVTDERGRLVARGSVTFVIGPQRQLRDEE